MKCKNCKNHCKRIDDDGTLYNWCGLIVDCPDPDLERACKYFKVASNADKIRAMTNEELAKLIDGNLCEIVCGGITSYCYGDCEKHILDWLKQEAEE